MFIFLIRIYGKKEVNVIFVYKYLFCIKNTDVYIFDIRLTYLYFYLDDFINIHKDNTLNVSLKNDGKIQKSTLFPLHI